MNTRRKTRRSRRNPAARPRLSPVVGARHGAAALNFAGAVVALETLFDAGRAEAWSQAATGPCQGRVVASPGGLGLRRRAAVAFAPRRAVIAVEAGRGACQALDRLPRIGAFVGGRGDTWRAPLGHRHGP